jgi:hypothetical protein
LSTGYFAGTIGSLSIAQVMNQIISGMRTGKLIVNAGGARRTVNFRDGQIVFATSSQVHERLGAMLLQLKMISPEELKQVLAEAKPGKRIGQVLTSSRRLSANQLYSAMTFLVREIVIALFELNEGAFLFLDGPPSTDVVKLPDRTRRLVLEGMKRAEEIERLRRRLPPDLNVESGPRPPPAGMERLVLAVGGGRELGELRDSFEGSDHSFLSSIDELLQAGSLVQRAERISSRQAVTDQVPSALDLYAELIQTICGVLKAAGRDLKDLQSFFSDPLPGMEEPFAGVSLGDDGSINFDRLTANMGGQTSALRRAKGYDALDSFVSYAMFSAKNALAPDRPELAESLDREFHRIRVELGG